MHVIAFASQKGGAGKTTLTGHLAVQAEADGAGPVALIDTDPQASLADWWDAREADTPALAQVELASLREHLRSLQSRGFRVVMIDTPPAVLHSIRLVAEAADLVLIPTRPSPHDLRAIGRTVRLAEDASKPMLFVINGAAHRARITTEAAIALSQHGTVCPTILHQRTDLAASMASGQVAQELDPGGRTAGEIKAMWAYVHGYLHRRGRTHARTRGRSYSHTEGA